MSERIEATKWRVIGESRRGASHVRNGLRNQDALEYWVSESRDIVVLSVADGHGSYTFFRSDTGSRIAVETAVEMLRQFADPGRRSSSPSSILEDARRIIPDQLTGLWRKSVENHLRAHPISTGELDDLLSREGDVGVARVKTDPVVAYGSTVLGVLATQNFILYVQLGDGDILSVDVAGETRRAVERDATLVGNQTHSLCQRNASKEVRIGIQDCTENPPIMILASTDGYSNSFVSDSDFLRIGQDYLRAIQSDGMEKVEKEMARFLDETSSEGSGDDITLGVITRMDARGASLSRVPHAAVVQPKSGEEELSMAVADKLTAQLEDARNRINKLDSLVSELTGRIRTLQIGIAVALLVAIISLALGMLHFPKKIDDSAVVKPQTAAPAETRPPQAEKTLLKLTIGQSTLNLDAGTTLTSDQLGLGKNSGKVAQVRQTADGTGLELLNLGNTTWVMKSIEGTSRSVKTGEAVVLSAGLEVRCGKANWKIVSV